LLYTRRSLIRLAGAGFAPWSAVRSFAAADFWNTKDPDNWSAEEIAKLLKKSPWAREITGERTTSAKKPQDPLNSPFPTGRQRNPHRIPKPAAQKTVTTYRGTVVWESAKVIRDASHTPLPHGFDGQYVLSVSGIPLARSSGKNALDNVRHATMLQAKGKDPLEAAAVQQNQGNGAIYYIGFSREALAIGRDDKDVVFTTHMGKVVFTAKFNPKEMIYRGELAV
jgi:hypothetical protein